MVRSGLLVVLVACMLVGCSTSSPPSSTAVPRPDVTAATECPEGLTRALRQHLLTQPWAGELPVAAAVDSSPAFTFTSSLVASMVGCFFTTEVRLASGDAMFQIFGIADGLDEDGVIAEVEDAGWEQPFPDSDPSTWQDPNDFEGGVQIFPRGVIGDHPALDFPDWADYLGPEDVLLLSGIAA